MLRLSVIPVALLACWCRRVPPDADSPPADDTAIESKDDTATDSGEDTATDSGSVVPTDFEIVAIDGETWAEEGYELVTYRLAEDAPNPYASLFPDQGPTFYLARPSEIEQGEALDVLAWFHGGAIGDDSDPERETPYGCQEPRIIDNGVRAISENFIPTTLARRNRWAVVVPRNDWCDAWTGWGPDDPVDPDHHYGWYHVQRVLDFVLGGGAGFSFGGELYGWGTSMGGTAAILAAARYSHYGGFDAIISDSAPSSMFWYYGLNHFGTDREILEHIFGGPPYDEDGQPTEAWQRYADASGEWLIASGLQVPLYAAWNRLDALADREHGESLTEAMDTYYPKTVRHGHHDFDHEAPGVNYHTQSAGSLPPWGYTAVAMVEFLQGTTPLWVEIEGGCDAGEGASSPCEIGSDVTAADAPSVRAFSGGAVRVASAADGVGTVWCGRLPDEVEGGSTIRITLVMSAKALDGLPAERGVVTLRYEEAGRLVGEKSVKVGDFLPGGSEDMDLALAQYEATRLEVTVSAPDAGKVCVDSHGVGTLYLDALIVGVP